MPAYMSHIIMARDVYDKIDNNNVSLDYMLTFSLGGDLCRFSKCRRLSHKIKMEEFIDNIWNYIKENDLSDDGRYMGFLYGHICHYYMDMVCHPLIRKIDKISIRTRMKSHTLIEGYINSYLVEYKYNRDIRDVNTNDMFKGSVTKLSKMIDYVYDKTYGVKYLSISYYFSKIMYSKVKWLFIIFGKRLLRKISGFDKYISINKDIDIVNNDKSIYYKDYLGNRVNDSFIDLYNKSIELSIKRINRLK